MKIMFQKQSKEKKIVYFIIGLFILNAFGLIPLGVIGAYTTPPMKIMTTKTLDNGTISETVHERYYTDGLSEKIQTNIYEFFRYSLPVTMTGYFVVTLPEFSYDYIGVSAWVLSLISIPFVIKKTAGIPAWRRIIYVYFIVMQLSGMWALSRVNFECISFIDYPIRPGGFCGI